MKTKRLVARIDDKDIQKILEASQVSGIPVAEITRKGSVKEANEILKMFAKRKN